MAVLEQPVKRWITGKLPTHSGTKNLHKNFKNIDEQKFYGILMKNGFINNLKKPTKKSLEAGLLDTCGKNAIWNLQKVEQLFVKAGVNISRQIVNQEISGDPNGIPEWVNLGTIASYFNVTGTTVGKWLTKLDLRDKKGNANQKAIDSNLGNNDEITMKINGRKTTKKMTRWNLYAIQELLLKNGYEMDFDYAKHLKGTGKNSDVKVTTIDDRAQLFMEKFTTTFKNTKLRKDCIRIVEKENKLVVKKAEELMGKPGFITKEEYKKYIK